MHAYLTDIITSVARTFEGLTNETKSQLEETLLDETIRAAISERRFNSEDLIIRMDVSERPYYSALSPIVAQKILEAPILLDELRQLATANPKEWMAWDNIKNEIRAIKELSLRERKQKKKRAEEIQGTIMRMVVSEIFQNNIIRTEYLQLIEPLLQYIHLSIEPIKSAAELYFIDHFRNVYKNRNIQSIEFFEKKSGVQLGLKMRITYIESTEGTEMVIRDPDSFLTPPLKHVSYFIKTHQGGSTAEHSSMNPIDPKELLVYQALHYAGYGSKVHFFFEPNLEGSFFIATQDASFTRRAHATRFFKTYSELSDEFNQEHLQRVTPEAKKQLLGLDILSRLFVLQDVTTNGTNFGRVITQFGDRLIEEWKIIDFRIESRAMYLYHGIFGGFLAGNGMYNYTGCLASIVKDRSEKERMATALAIFSQFHSGESAAGTRMPLLDALTRAHDEVSQYCQKHAVFLKISAAALEDLERYVAAVKQNFQELHTGICDHYALLVSTAEESDRTSVISSPTY